MNFDIGHFYCVNEDPCDALEALFPYVKHVHLEDISARKHEHLIPGYGDIDFIPVLNMLQDKNYDGYVTVELYPYQQTPKDAAEQAIVYLKKIANIWDK